MSAAYGEGFRFVLEERVDAGCCIVCGRRSGGVYYCLDCAFNSQYEGVRVSVSSQRAPTATQVGRSMRLRQERATEWEQLSQLWSCVDSDIEHLAEIEDVRASRSVRRLANGHDRRGRLGRGYTLGSRRVFDRWLSAWERVGARACDDLLPGWEAKQRKLIRRLWPSFCRAWHDVGWAALDDATRPG